MNKHTPGPWYAQIVRWPNGQLNGAPSVYAPNGDDGGRHVCVLTDNGQLEANSRLIAAAPELLEACESFMAEWDSMLSSDFAESPLAKVANLCRAAIGKATK